MLNHCIQVLLHAGTCADQGLLKEHVVSHGAELLDLATFYASAATEADLIPMIVGSQDTAMGWSRTLQAVYIYSQGNQGSLVPDSSPSKYSR
jgi:hypothetical protein